ncbi:MAG: RNase adapter RapZ [Deltaproteobacteria bacterium]|nr:RNase adapter RapZ [Deltaproteobacteria bacterium]
MRLVVLSGPSGSGKSTAIKALEDAGFFCVDNMPVALLPKFMELISASPDIYKAAAVVDVRERGFLSEFSSVFSGLRASGYRAELLYLEASDEALVRRFSETRRAHPLAASESPAEGIARERDILKDVKSLADKVIDTTSCNVHQLRDLIKEFYAGPALLGRIAVNLISFGFRWGIPAEADIVMDIRFLPNPYFVESLKDFDGSDEPVRRFVLSSTETGEFLERFKGFLSYLIPLYLKEGKSYLTIAIGCTGGRHRSVVVADEITKSISSPTVAVRKRHRDIGKP